DGLTLSQHTYDVIKCIEKLYYKIPHHIFSSRIDNPEKIKDILLLSGLFHDLGKVYPVFQKQIGNLNYLSCLDFFDKKVTSLPNVRHNIVSLLFIDKQKLIETRALDGNESLYTILLSSVAFHHWKKSEQDYILGISKDLKDLSQFILSEYPEKDLMVGDFFANILIENLKNLDIQIDNKKAYEFISFDYHMANMFCNGSTLMDIGVIPPYTLYFLPSRLSMELEMKINPLLWVYLAGFLMRADHFASWIEKESYKTKDLTIEIDLPNNDLAGVLKSIYGDNFWQYRKLMGENITIKDSNIILVAPTGIGKTEFSLLWAGKNKFFYTLPIRVAVNQIFDRIRGYFSTSGGNVCEEDSYVGILHSDADLYVHELYENKFPIEDNQGEIYTILELSKTLSLPSIVCTGDQIFPAALKYPQYEKIYSTLGYSRLIIDEVQAYDPRACAIIVKLVEDIVKLGGKFLIMTATLPFFVKEIIERIADVGFEYVDLYSEISNDLVRHKYELVEKDIMECFEEVLQKSINGARVIVVLNTIKKAEEFYEKIRNDKRLVDNIYCEIIHSRLTINQRREREARIVNEFSNPKPLNENKGKILVSTQVIEASLDIDADYLFTEIAPIDSLIQRMGRIMRRVNVLNGKIKEDKSITGNQNFEYGRFYVNNVPNIYIFYQKNDNLGVLESGKGRVYNRYLLEKTLEILYSKREKELKENSKQSLVDELYAELRERNQSNSYLKDSYLKVFHETLSILNSGYVCEKIDEARKLFREIHTSRVVYNQNLQIIKTNIINKVIEIVNSSADDDNLWIWFKRDIIAEFVINDYLGNYRVLGDLGEILIRDLEISEDKLSWEHPKHKTYKILKKIVKYCKGIFVVEFGNNDAEYTRNSGFEELSSFENLI
ncbi:MAG: CRISPR-associated helicase Cas3', partial [Candidatus Calescibacterium sp.]|nr:CRISPR-associated helicase Cas3' [Candidatus Calescibacterium sp.]MDW8133398.1 CRISPR-associated helicase Cas3' [Candidatus Calescibacterium sp.]